MGQGTLLVLNIYQLSPAAVGVEPNTMEHPDGINKVNTCSLLLKAVYINFQEFMQRGLYCVTREVLGVAGHQDWPFTAPEPVGLGLEPLVDSRGPHPVRQGNNVSGRGGGQSS